MNRKWLMGIAVAVACVCVAILVSGRNAATPNLTSSAVGAEPGNKKPSTTVWEYGPTRTKEKGDLWPPVSAYREIRTGDATAFYGVQTSQGVTISAESADDLIAFYEKYKKSETSKAKEVASASVRWLVATREGETLSIMRRLNDGKWIYGSPAVFLDDDFFAGVKAAILDIKALKAVPFSVNP